MEIPDYALNDEAFDDSLDEDVYGDTLPITYPNGRFAPSRAARPDDENVERARRWIEENQK